MNIDGFYKVKNVGDDYAIMKFLQNLPVDGEVKLFYNPKKREVLLIVKTKDLVDKKLLEIILGPNPCRKIDYVDSYVRKIYWYVKYDKP